MEGKLSGIEAHLEVCYVSKEGPEVYRIVSRGRVATLKNLKCKIF
jgi:hypothetical protein